MKTKIWNDLARTQYRINYTNLLIEKFQNYDLLVNVFLAIATSASIGAWVVWNEFPLVWASIIAISNIVTVIKPYFPYSKYIKTLNDKYILAQDLFLTYERVWYQIEKAKLTEDEIAEKYFELCKRQNEIFNFESIIYNSNDKKLKQKSEQLYLDKLKKNHNIT